MKLLELAVGSWLLAISFDVPMNDAPTFAVCNLHSLRQIGQIEAKS
jgi:hypothetical protein